VQIEQLRHQREQVNTQAAELVAQKQAQDGRFPPRRRLARNNGKAWLSARKARSLDVELAQKTCPFKIFASALSRISPRS